MERDVFLHQVMAARWWLSASQEGACGRNSMFTFDFPPSELKEINVCLLTFQSVIFYTSSPRERMQSSMSLFIMEIHVTHLQI
jgi:hypothetical protein